MRLEVMSLKSSEIPVRAAGEPEDFLMGACEYEWMIALVYTILDNLTLKNLKIGFS